MLHARDIAANGTTPERDTSAPNNNPKYPSGITMTPKSSVALTRIGAEKVDYQQEQAGDDAPIVGSAFREGAFDRQLLQHARRGRIVTQPSAVDYDQKPWSLLYRALVDGLGASPKTFQLLYPFTPWNWATQNPGFIGAGQYNFCSTVPQWSAVGAYSSSGDRFDQAYQEFLNVIVAATDDRDLRVKIQAADNTLTEATNAYTSVLLQAQSAYADDPNVSDNVPPFTKWLGEPAGKGWQTQIARAEIKMNQAQTNYDALVDQANTPGLADALTQAKNQDFFAKLNDPGLTSFPKVPNFTISETAQSWVDRVQAGQGPAGATFGFSNRDASYDYSETWAGGSASVSRLFWEVKVDGKWERITEFESDQELVVSVLFEAVDQIQIQPSNWYNGSFLRSKANGPFKRGYSPYGRDGTQAVFGKKGFIGLLKTAMYVGYKPTFTVTTSQSTFSRFLEKFKVATGLRIGPFSFEASGGSEKSGWSASETGRSFSGTSTSDTALILGVAVAELPSGATDGLEDRQPELGTVYRFAGGDGPVLAEGKTEAEARALGGESWQPAITPLRNLRATREAAPFTEDLDGPDAEVQILQGVTHVSVFPPFNQRNGGPNPANYYRIRATNALTNQPVDLRYMTFVGIGPYTGVARFAS